MKTTPQPYNPHILTGLHVDLVGWVLVAGEHAHDDGVVAVLHQLLHLLGGLDRLGGRARLLAHVLHDTWMRGGTTNEA